MRRLIRRPSPAMVIACLALLVALAGTGVAAVSIVLPPNSVGTLQLRTGAVTSAKVRNGSLLRADFASGQVPAGAIGPVGPAGPQGAKGDKGDKGDKDDPATSLWAVVASDGTLSRSAGVTSVSHVGTGSYRVRFNRNIDQCNWEATIGAPAMTASTGMIAVELSSTGNDTVQVTTLSTAAALADRAFHLAVLC
jgi:hypothetical protein